MRDRESQQIGPHHFLVVGRAGMHDPDVPGFYEPLEHDAGFVMLVGINGEFEDRVVLEVHAFFVDEGGSSFAVRYSLVGDHGKPVEHPLR